MGRPQVIRELLFTGEVAVESPLGDPRPAGDVPDRGPLGASRGEEIEGRIEQSADAARSQVG